MLGERRAPGEHVEEQAAHRVDVGARVDAHAADLLRRHEVERAHPLAGPRLATPGQHLLRQAEVGHEDVVVGSQQDVAGLDVTVHQPRRVDGIERIADLGCDPRGAIGAERSRAADERADVITVDVAHDEERDAVRLAGVQHGDHVRVLDRRRAARLAQEALLRLRVVEQLRSDDLERHGSPERDLVGAIHDAHAAAPDDVVDPVPGEDAPG